MTEYIIDLYKNNDYVTTYLVTDESIQLATKRAIEEVYSDGYNIDYYITYSDETSETKEGQVKCLYKIIWYT